MRRKYTQFTYFFFFSCAVILTHASAIAMEKKAHVTEQGGKPAMMHYIYAHAFGELGSYGTYMIGEIRGKDKHSSFSSFDFSDTQNSYALAFYTKRSVIDLAKHLKEQVIGDNKKSIILIGRSMGAGTTINCLNALNTYDRDYFDGTDITDNDAKVIMEAINKGGIVLTAPCIDMRKVKFPITIASKIIGSCLAGYLAYYFGSSQIVSDKITPNLRLGLMGLSFVAAYYASCIERGLTSLITKFIVPLITRYNFDPTHPTPLQSAEGLRGVLQCPILLHFNANDFVLENPDEDTVQIYDALKNNDTRILISTDSWHNGFSQQFHAALTIFGEKLRREECSTLKDDQEVTTILEQWDTKLKPSVDALRENIKNKK